MLHDLQVENEGEVKVVGVGLEAADVEAAIMRQNAFEGEIGTGAEEVESGDDGEVAAGGFASDEQQAAAELFLRMVDQVLSNVEAVFVAGWVRMFRSQAIPDADDGQAGAVGEVLEQDVLRLLVLQHPASAVDVVEDALGLAGLGNEDSTWDLAPLLSRGQFDVLAAIQQHRLGERRFAILSH